MSDYWKKRLEELNKNNVKKSITSGKSTSSNKSASSNKSTTSNNYWKQKLAELENDDIAPLTAEALVPKTTVTAPLKPAETTNKGSYFADGYDFGDITKTILGSRKQNEAEKEQKESDFDSKMMQKYSSMSLTDIEKELARLEEEEKTFKAENGGKVINYLSKVGSYFGEGVSGKSLSSARAKSESNIDTINDYTREKEILNTYRKQRATEEYLGGLSKEQLQLLDNISKADDLEKAKPLALAMQGDNADMAGLVYYQQTKGDMDASDDAFTTLSEQLKKKFPDKGNDEIYELINNMVELRKNQVNAEERATLEAQSKEFATEHPVGAFALSRGATFVSGMTGLAELAYQWNNEYGLDTNAPGFLLTHTSNTIDEQIQLDHDWEINVGDSSVDGFDLFYKAGTGIVDNLARYAASGGNTTIAGAMMFTQGTTQSIITGKEKGYSDAKALTLGLLDGTFEAISEKISLDIIFKDGGGVLKTLAKSFAAEGGEEVTSNWLNRIADEIANGNHSELSKMYESYKAEGLTDAQAMAEVVLSAIGEDVESFVIGGLSGAVMGGGNVAVNSVANAIQQNEANKLTDIEQQVVDKVVEDRIAEATEDGKTLTKAEEKKIREEVRRALDRGYIDTDTIESVLGGEDYQKYKKLYDARAKYEQSANDEIKALQEEHKKLQEEYEELNKLAMTEATLGDHNRQAEIKDRQKEINAKIGEVKAELKELEADTSVSDLKARFDENFVNVVKGSRLEESYRRKQIFEADFEKFKGTKHEDAARKSLENAVKAGADNSKGMQTLVESNARFSANTGVVFEYTTNEKEIQAFTKSQTEAIKEIEEIPEAQRTEEQNKLLAEMKGTLEKVQSGDMVVDGTKKTGVITVNLDSPKALNVITGHEIAHLLEKAKHYKKAQDALFKYASMKGVNIEEELDNRARKYGGIKDSDSKAELFADLVGGYLYTDYDFVVHLANTDQSVFHSMWDSVKYLYKMATAGSKEARQLERVKRNFEKAYKEFTKSGAKVEGEKYSITEPFVDKNGNRYENAVLLDTGAFDNVSPKNWWKVLKNHLENRVEESTFIMPVADESGNTQMLEFAKSNERVSKNGGKQHKVLGELYMTSDNISKLSAIHIDEIVEVSESDVPYHTEADGHGWLDANGWLHRTAYVINAKNGSIYQVTMDIAKTEDGRHILYALNGKTKKVGNAEVNSIVTKATKGSSQNSNFDDILPQNSEKSIGEANYSLTSEQEEYFKDSKVRDENGNLKVMYHGTSKGGFTSFDTYGSNYGLMGTGSYFTDNKSVAESYTNKGKGNNKQVYESYLNITNPLDMDAEGNAEEWAKAFPDVDFPDSGTNEDFYRAVEEFYSDQMMPKWEAAEEIRDSIQFGMGYDGITHIGGGRVNADGERHQVYIAFEPEQIKNIDNIAPTKDADIRYSLSEDTEGRKLSNEQQEYFKNVSPLLKDENGNIKRYYHGTSRGDRVGTYFNPERATSGPMAFFTDNPEIAEGYSKSKADTSMAYDPDYDSYETQFRVNINGHDMSLIDAWRYLPMDARARIKDRAEHTHYDWDDYETLIYDESTTEAGGGFSWQIREARGNILRALNEQWLNSGNLFNEEGKYIDVLKFIGVHDEFKKLGYGEPYYKDPYFRDEKVFEVYLNVTNPFHTADVDEEFLNDARDWVENTDLSIYESETADSDLWDKRSLDPYEWLDRLEDDINNGTTHAWTSIPDVITDFLKEYGGYDGIVDAGGKHTGYGHQVVIPFYSEQIKNIDNETPTTDVHIDLSLSEEGDTSFAPDDSWLVYGNRVTVPDDIAPMQETVSEPMPMQETVSKAETVEDIAPTVAPTEEAADTESKPAKRSELHQSIIDRVKGKFTEKGFDFDDVLNKAKNLTTVSTNDNTPQRVMEKALGYKQGQILADETINKVAQNETEGIKWLNSFTDRKNGVLAQISKQYNIKPGSKKSAAAQMYAEGFYVNKNNEIVKYGDRELAIDFPDAKVQANIKGLARDPRIRQIYDETLAAINESRSRNLYPEIPRLDNYFLHFRAMEDTFSRLGLPFNPNDIRAHDLPTDLNGVTADLKPGQPYFASAMHREGMRTSFDLLGGLERYLSSAKNQIYHIDDIQNLRALRNYIADTYGQAKGLESLDNLSEEEAQERITQVYSSHLSTFAKFLHEEANILAGKKTLIDRGIEGAVGRKWFAFFDTVNKQVGSNMVGFNVSSSLTNFLPVVQTFAKTNKFDFTKAFTQTVASKIGSIFGKTDSFVENNPTIIRRKGAERFYRTPFQKAGDAGYVLMSAVDDISTELIVRTKYNELTRKGMDEQKASFEADKWVSRLMGDRSLGQMPLWYNSKMLGLVTKFQLEVRNQLDSQFYDTIQEAKVSNEDIENGLLRNAKTAAKIGSTFFQLAVAQHIFGKAFESVAGYNPAFDIIEVLIKTLGLDDDEEDEDTPLDNLKEGFYALLEDLPYTSVLRDGGRIPISSALPVKQIFSGKDKYGNEKSIVETLEEIAPYYLLPTGYGQIKKTAQGLNMFSDEHPVAGSYTDSDSLRFPVEDTPLNRLQAGVFGQYANKNAQTYFDEGYAPLKEKQIQEYVDSDMPIEDYWKYREGLKGLSKIEEKADYIYGLDLPIDTKNLLINNLTDRKEPIDLTDYGNYDSFEEFDYAQQNPEKYAFLEAEGIGYLGYKALDEDTKESWSWAFKNQDKYRYFKENGVYPEDYSVYRIPMLDFKDEEDEAYEWAFDYPNKAEFAKVFDGIKEYRGITKELFSIKGDPDGKGGYVYGTQTQNRRDFIASLQGLDEGQKAILYRVNSDSKTDKRKYNRVIVDYLNSRDDISYDEMNTILEELDFTVDSEGYISW